MAQEDNEKTHGEGSAGCCEGARGVGGLAAGARMRITAAVE
jgi:hypothetical protein